jgi:hypothetical protein
MKMYKGEEGKFHTVLNRYYNHTISKRLISGLAAFLLCQTLDELDGERSVYTSLVLKNWFHLRCHWN